MTVEERSFILVQPLSRTIKTTEKLRAYRVTLTRDVNMLMLVSHQQENTMF